MSKDKARRRILEIGIIPVIRASSAAHAMRAAEAVSAGGIPIVEITMTVPGAIDLIRDLAATVAPKVLVGAGTVLDPVTAERCIDVGAQFIVSPGLHLSTVKTVNSRGVLMIAGALTPGEVIEAWDAGSDFVKVFPCDSVGGAKYIQSLKGPLPQIPMIPTGGVNLENVGDLIRAGADAVGVGGELISKAALSSGNLEQITAAAARYLSVIYEARRILHGPC